MFKLTIRARSCSLLWHGARSSISTTSGCAMEMPPCDFKPEPYKGMPYEKMVEVRKKHISPGVVSYYRKPLLIHQGHMQWLFDDKGRRYLDLIAGIVTINVGHSHPKVNQRLKDQVDKLWHTTNIYMHPPLHEYAEKLAAKLPGKLNVIYFTNSGGEANELAMMMSRLYTGKFDIVTLRSSYHGTSPYTQGMTGMGNMKFGYANGFGVHHAMNPDVYRGLWGGKHCRDSVSQTTRSCDCPQGECRAADHYAAQLKDTVSYSVSKGNLAAFFAEPIQGIGGTIQYPHGYLQKAYEIARENGGLCVADEVQTGFGRIGSHFWGFQAHGVEPDIVTMAKGIGNGFPMAAVVTTEEIANTMSRAFHFNTYGGNPMACAVGSAVLDVLEEDRSQETAARVGDTFIRGLMSLRDEFEVVGDVRGKGLLLGLELVKSKETKEPLPSSDVIDIWEELREEGILMGKGGFLGNILRIKPPLCVTEEDVKFAVTVMRKVLSNYSARK